MKPKEYIKIVILNAIQDLQRLSLQLVNNMRGRYPAGRPLKCGMTGLLNNGGFTLIELLVVVLIIGILAAVAVPQYRVAVLKSRYTQLQSAVHSLKEAETVYFLTHGEHPLDLEKLDVEMPVIPGYGFEIWLADDKKSGVIAGSYKSLYYHESLFSSSRQCRANKNDKLANAVCINLGGTYVNTYESQKAYRLP